MTWRASGDSSIVKRKPEATEQQHEVSGSKNAIKMKIYGPKGTLRMAYGINDTLIFVLVVPEMEPSYGYMPANGTINN